MKAAWYRTQGAALDVLEVGELPTPDAGPGEVRVRLYASGVNPVDVKRRHGGRGSMPSDLVIPHFDGAGIIDQVGDGVDEGRIGRRVWLFEAQWQSDFGSAAEFVTVPESRAVPLPEGASFDIEADRPGAMLTFQVGTSNPHRHIVMIDDVVLERS